MYRLGRKIKLYADDALMLRREMDHTRLHPSRSTAGGKERWLVATTKLLETLPASSTRPL